MHTANTGKSRRHYFSITSFLICLIYFLKDTERLLSGLCALGFVGDDVESNSLRKRTALTDSYDISILHTKGGRAVGGNVLVSLLVTAVLSDVVQVVSSDDDGSLHLGGDDLPLEDSSTDGNISGEGTLLVNV